jgi:hypothetical protein
MLFIGFVLTLLLFFFFFNFRYVKGVRTSECLGVSP